MTRPARMASIPVPSTRRGLPPKPFDPRELETEKGFMDAVRRLARLRGWALPGRDPGLVLPGIVFHPTIAYRSEPGWPDLTMVRLKDRRLIFAELKTDKKTSTLKPRQEQVLQLLRDALEFDLPANVVIGGRRVPRIQVFVWRPSDWAEIERVLA